MLAVAFYIFAVAFLAFAGLWVYRLGRSAGFVNGHAVGTAQAHAGLSPVVGPAGDRRGFCSPAVADLFRETLAQKEESCSCFATEAALFDKLSGSGEAACAAEHGFGIAADEAGELSWTLVYDRDSVHFTWFRDGTRQGAYARSVA